jgi:hypothetical protein
LSVVVSSVAYVSAKDVLAGVLGGVPVDLDALSDAALLDHLRELSTVADAVSAELTRAIGVAHRRGAVGHDGAVSTQAWLRQRLRRGDAGAHLRAARVVEAVPELAEAYVRGEIGLRHVDVVAAVLPDLPGRWPAGSGSCWPSRPRWARRGCWPGPRRASVTIWPRMRPKPAAGCCGRGGG